MIYEQFLQLMETRGIVKAYKRDPDIDGRIMDKAFNGDPSLAKRKLTRATREKLISRLGAQAGYAQQALLANSDGKQVAKLIRKYNDADKIKLHPIEAYKQHHQQVSDIINRGRERSVRSQLSLAKASGF